MHDFERGATNPYVGQSLLILILLSSDLVGLGLVGLFIKGRLKVKIRDLNREYILPII